MSKNYIEKVIDEKVPFEPDYSKIKEQVNIKPQKASKKRWLWPSLSIGLVSIVIIITIIVSLSLRSNPNPTPTPTPTYDGVHFNNYNSNGDGSGDGIPSPTPPMVSYSIDVEKDNYEYNEEFIIKYTIIGIGGYEVTDRNNLNVKIVSDKFEFLSPTEYHFDLKTDISTYGNILSFGEEKNSIYPIEMELKVKAKKPKESLDTINIDSILFLLEFPLHEEFKELLLQGDSYNKGETYIYGADTFTKDLEWFHQFYYLNDELGTLLVDDDKEFKYYDKSYKKISYLSDYNVTPYKSLNRLYEKELITKDDYLDRLIGYMSDYKTYANIYIRDTIVIGEVRKNRSTMVYISKNIRVYFKWRPEYLELYESYFKSAVVDRKNLAKELVEILYKEEIITFAQYETEIRLIEEEGVPNERWRGEYEKAFIPFEVSMELYYDYIVE